ncbi:MAG: sigma-54-dependent Fis family transcriptional regulator [Planctomycetota bacterium]|nr:MAG: sigma-54-dependent Fis family transcriptional regulator [Planctomycetota bacterium]
MPPANKNASPVVRALYHALPHPSRDHMQAVYDAEGGDGPLRQAVAAAMAVDDVIAEHSPSVATVASAQSFIQDALQRAVGDIRLWSWLVAVSAKFAMWEKSFERAALLLSYLQQADLSALPYTYRLLAPRIRSGLELEYHVDLEASLAAIDEADTILLQAGAQDSDASYEFRVRRMATLFSMGKGISSLRELLVQEMPRKSEYLRRLGYDLQDMQRRFQIIYLHACQKSSEIDPSAISQEHMWTECLAALYRMDHAFLDRTLDIANKRWPAQQQWQSMRFLQYLGRDDISAARRLNRQLTGHEKIANEETLLLALRERRHEQARMILEELDPHRVLRYMEGLWLRLFLLEGDMDTAVAYLRELLSWGFSRRLIAPLSLAQEQPPQVLHEMWARVWEYSPGPRPISPPNRPTVVGKSALTAVPQYELVGASPVMDAVRQLIARFAEQSEPVLITGETGTGKEIAARLLHQSSNRAKQPFVAINCAGLPASLVEAELFGFVKGAFTGADRQRQGLFAHAGKGTLFLDEVEAMPLSTQAMLLRVLESGEYRALGSETLLHTKARIIAATNVPLEIEVQAQRFRQDLFYRLDRLAIVMPPLREHIGDIPMLARYFLQLLGQNPLPIIEDRLIHIWQNYDWPGNVREFRNEVERLVIMSDDHSVLRANDSRLNRPTSGPSPAETAVAAVQQLSQAQLPPRGDERRTVLLQALQQRGRMRQKEISQLLRCSAGTTRTLVRALVQEGVVQRVDTSNNLRTSYYTYMT